MTPTKSGSGDQRAGGFETSPTLLLRAQANDAAAWEKLVDLYAPLVYHWCRRSQLPPEDAADVFQDVFQAVAKSLPTFRRRQAGDSFRGWLRIIASNKIRDHFRKGQHQAHAAGGTDAQMRLHAVADPLADEDASETSLVSQQLRAMLETIQHEFEPRTWQAFWRVQVEGQGTRDVGEALGMTPAAVRKAKLRVLARLRHELGELLD